MNPVTVWGKPLQELDPEMRDLLEMTDRQRLSAIGLIASVDCNPFAIVEALGSALTNKYPEDSLGNLYIGRNELIENLCRSRALQAHGLERTLWSVDFLDFSGSPVNLAPYTVVIRPNDRIMGLGLPCGTQPIPGYSFGGRNVSANFESVPLKVHSSTGYIDYDKLREEAYVLRPSLIICGGSAYPGDWDYACLRSIADNCEALLLCDMTHISGLVTAKEAANPFDFCDIITMTTHKSQKGPRFSMIFYRKDMREDVRENINFAVSSVQDGMPNHQIRALAVALKLAQGPEFKQYVEQAKANAVALGNYLMSKGYKLVTGGTKNHLVLWDLRPLELTGNNFEKLCDLCNISVTKDALFVQTNASLGGVRIGTSTMTAMNLSQEDFRKIGEFLHRAVKIACRIKEQYVEDFDKGLVNNTEIEDLKVDVEQFAGSFLVPKFLVLEMKSKED